MSEIIPANLTAGLPWRWGVSRAAWPAPAWQLRVALRGLSGSLDLESAADGSAHVFEADGVKTGSLPAGDYAWQITAVAGDGREQLVDVGRVRIGADLRVAGLGHDPRSHAERMVAMIESVLENRASIEQRRYKINNRELERTSVADLRKLLVTYRAEIAAERSRRAGRSSLGRNHLVRF